MTAAQEPQATEADRETAHRIWNEALCNSGVPDWNPREFFARALAAERAKALAPVLALADELDHEARNSYLKHAGPNARAKHDAAHRIRRAAGQQP